MKWLWYSFLHPFRYMQGLIFKKIAQMATVSTIVETSNIVQKATGENFWMRLDNAAKIYPAVQNEELTSVFRLSCVLNHRIKIKPLLDAIRLIEGRFPYYRVKSKKGFFWYYLEFHDEPIPLMPDVTVPCRSFNKGDLIFRILVRNMYGCF